MNAPFIDDDKNILSKYYSLEHYVGAGFGGIVKYFFYPLFSDVAVCWFCSFYSFFMVLACKIARKKSVIILGGVDCANLPEIGYGVWIKKYKHPFLKFALKNATEILTVDMSLKDKIEKASKLNLPKIRLLRTAQKSDFWVYSTQKEQTILTVAGCQTKSRGLMKGLDILNQVAKLLPFKFIVVGTETVLAKETCGTLSPNITFIKKIPRKELLAYYQKSKVYFQPSRFEGLPGAICEAILCGAIPVGSAVCGIPTAIADSGFVVKSGDIQGFVVAIQKAMNLPNILTGRERIKEMFDYDKREKGLVEVIEKLLH